MNQCNAYPTGFQGGVLIRDRVEPIQTAEKYTVLNSPLLTETQDMSGRRTLEARFDSEC